MPDFQTSRELADLRAVVISSRETASGP